MARLDLAPAYPGAGLQFSPMRLAEGINSGFGSGRAETGTYYRVEELEWNDDQVITKLIYLDIENMEFLSKKQTCWRILEPRLDSIEALASFGGAR